MDTFDQMEVFGRIRQHIRQKHAIQWSIQEVSQLLRLNCLDMYIKQFQKIKVDGSLLIKDVSQWNYKQFKEKSGVNSLLHYQKCQALVHSIKDNYGFFYNAVEAVEQSFKQNILSSENPLSSSDHESSNTEDEKESSLKRDIQCKDQEEDQRKKKEETAAIYKIFNSQSTKIQKNLIKIIDSSKGKRSDSSEGKQGSRRIKTTLKQKKWICDKIQKLCLNQSSLFWSSSDIHQLLTQLGFKSILKLATIWGLDGFIISLLIPLYRSKQMELAFACNQDDIYQLLWLSDTLNALKYERRYSLLHPSLNNSSNESQSKQLESTTKIESVMNKQNDNNYSDLEKEEKITEESQKTTTLSKSQSLKSHQLSSDGMDLDERDESDSSSSARKIKSNFSLIFHPELSGKKDSIKIIQKSSTTDQQRKFLPQDYSQICNKGYASQRIYRKLSDDEEIETQNRIVLPFDKKKKRRKSITFQDSEGKQASLTVSQSSYNGDGVFTDGQSFEKEEPNQKFSHFQEFILVAAEEEKPLFQNSLNSIPKIIEISNGLMPIEECKQSSESLSIFESPKKFDRPSGEFQSQKQLSNEDFHFNTQQKYSKQQPDQFSESIVFLQNDCRESIQETVCEGDGSDNQFKSRNNEVTIQKSQGNGEICHTVSEKQMKSICLQNTQTNNNNAEQFQESVLLLDMNLSENQVNNNSIKQFNCFNREEQISNIFNRPRQESVLFLDQQNDPQSSNKNQFQESVIFEQTSNSNLMLKKEENGFQESVIFEQPNSSNQIEKKIENMFQESVLFEIPSNLNQVKKQEQNMFQESVLFEIPSNSNLAEKKNENGFQESVIFEQPSSSNQVEKKIENMLQESVLFQISSNSNQVKKQEQNMFQESVIFTNSGGCGVGNSEKNQNHHHQNNNNNNNNNHNKGSFRESVAFQESVILNENKSPNGFQESQVLLSEVDNVGHKTSIKQEFQESMIFEDMNKGTKYATSNQKEQEKIRNPTGLQEIIKAVHMDANKPITLNNELFILQEERNSYINLSKKDSSNPPKQKAQNEQKQNKQTSSFDKANTFSDEQIKFLKIVKKASPSLCFNPFEIAPYLKKQHFLKIRIKSPDGSLFVDENINTEGASFGRKTENLINFPKEQTISSFHAEIFFNNFTFFLRDKGSKLGTYLKINRIDLTQQMRLQLSISVELRILFLDLEKGQIQIETKRHQSTKIHSFSLKDGESIKLGRDKEKCDVEVKEQSISNEHAMILFLNGTFQIIDCDSLNGIWLRLSPKGEVSAPFPISSGMQFRLFLIHIEVLKLSCPKLLKF